MRTRGQKLQTTVRFESEVLKTIETLGEQNGLSTAETVRRLVKQAIDRQVR